MDEKHAYKTTWKIQQHNVPHNLNKGYIPSYLREGFDESKVIKLPTTPKKEDETHN